jgi:hypothetical protein
MQMHENLRVVLKIAPIGTYNSIITMYLLQAIGNDYFGKMTDLIIDNNACCLSPQGHLKYFKCFTTAMRRTNRWPDGVEATVDEIGKCCYWEYCVGRSVNVADWAEEKVLRCTDPIHLKLPLVEGKPNLQTNQSYLKELELVIKDMINELMLDEDEMEDFETTILKRQNLMTSGSAPGHKLVVEGKNINIRKRTCFEQISGSDIMKWLDDTPIVKAVGSDKFEISKARSIYGTDIKDFFIFSAVMRTLDHNLCRINGVEIGLSGADEVRCVLRKLNLVKHPLNECTMLDYSDFNLQHTPEAQSILFKVIKEKYALQAAPPSLVKASHWCELALLNQTVRFAQLKGEETLEHKVVQGMFSGIKATNFINTCLNVCYSRLTFQRVKALYNVEPVNLSNTHQGDDVWITNHSRLWAMIMYNTFSNCGFIFNPLKQAFSRHVGEFLRVMYSKEGARGFLTRAMGSVIIKNLQSRAMISPGERSMALDASVHLLVRRGFSIAGASVLWDMLIPHSLIFRVEAAEVSKDNTRKKIIIIINIKKSCCLQKSRA